MIAYKGFGKNLVCLGYQLNDMGSMRQRRQIAEQNGFHCCGKSAGLSCSLSELEKLQDFVVKAFGDLDEDDRDTKNLVHQDGTEGGTGFLMLLLRGAAIYGNTSGPPMVQPGLQRNRCGQ